jgi:hypothetical protein
MPSSAKAGMAICGWLKERSQIVRSARDISDQSTGTISRYGLAFHIWSSARRVGSSTSMVCN